VSGVAGTAETVRPEGALGWLASTDHKRTAAKLAAVAFVFFLASGLLALIMRTELASPGTQIVSADHYDQLFTMHGSGMIYLVIGPLALALGLYLVPLQVGAADIAAPRLALLGFYLITGGGLVMYGGFLTDQGAGRAGWTAYYPLSSGQATPGTGMDMWIIGVMLAAAGAILLAVTILATIVRLRAPGMTMLRVPVFTWTMLVTTLMAALSFPVLVVAMALLLIDRHSGGGIFDTSGGPIAYQNLFWFWGHPVVYVVFFPFLGAVAEVIATFSRRRFFGYKPLTFSLLAFTGLSMSVWAHHKFATGQVSNEYFALTSHLLTIPAGLEYLALIGTMVGGSILLRTPMLFAIGFLLLFLIGGLTGVLAASPPLDYHETDSYFIVGHFHYTLFGGSLFGAFAAVYYWFPKWTGVKLREGLGKLHFALLFVGANLTFFPMLFLGIEGMPRRIADYPAQFTDLNRVATAGSYVIGLAILVFIVNLVVSLRRRDEAGDDPWEGQTLEWWTTSPPPRLNFRSLPPIRSYAPLLDLREEREAERAGHRAQGASP
jgi:cytochrome c oxidase subunit 1